MQRKAAGCAQSAWILMLALLAAAVSAPLASNAAAGKASAPGKKASMRVVRIDGVLKGVDMKAWTVSVKADNGETVTAEILKDHHTKIVKGNRENLGMVALKAGQRVRMEYRTDAQGKKVARWVLLDPVAKPAKKAQKPAAK